MRLLRRLFRWLRLRSSLPDPLREVLAAPRNELRVVVGLGNPGPQYASSRHNVGFRAVDQLARELGLQWTDDSPRTTSLLAAGRQGSTLWVLCKPLTFMNLSGQAVARLLSVTAAPGQQLLVIYDDMDLPFGAIRVRGRGSAGTHNGMRSVLKELGTDQVARLRVGIGQSRPGKAIDFVLGDFSPRESEALSEVLERAAAATLVWASDGATAAMNQHNRS